MRGLSSRKEMRMSKEILSKHIEKYVWFDGIRYTWEKSCRYAASNGKLLHREVWKHFNGEIPEGYVIHHIDGDPSNNDISNLQIMTISEHTKFHRQSSETKKYTCDYCGKEFYGKNATRGTHRFCSKECNSKWAYKNRNETRICAECGKEFTTNKYRKTKYCSKECVAKVNSRVHKKNKH